MGLLQADRFKVEVKISVVYVRPKLAAGNCVSGAGATGTGSSIFSLNVEQGADVAASDADQAGEPMAIDCGVALTSCRPRMKAPMLLPSPRTRLKRSTGRKARSAKATARGTTTSRLPLWSLQDPLVDIHVVGEVELVTSCLQLTQPLSFRNRLPPNQTESLQLDHCVSLYTEGVCPRLWAGARRQRRLVRDGVDRVPSPCCPRTERQLGRRNSAPVLGGHCSR
jgi:hypothetical protein